MLVSIRLVSQLSEFAFFGARFRLRTFCFVFFTRIAKPIAITNKLWYNKIAQQTEYRCKVGLFYPRDKYTLFLSYLLYEFDKNANSIYVSMIKPILRKVC